VVLCLHQSQTSCPGVFVHTGSQWKVIVNQVVGMLFLSASLDTSKTLRTSRLGFHCCQKVTFCVQARKMRKFERVTSCKWNYPRHIW